MTPIFSNSIKNLESSIQNAQKKNNIYTENPISIG